MYLETIQDNSTSSGSFFLGSGYINGVWKYTYYIRKNDAFYLEQIRAKGTPVKYTSGKPRIEWTERVKTDAKINKWSLRGTGCDCNYKKTIYIPEGSIKQNYHLDAK